MHLKKHKRQDSRKNIFHHLNIYLKDTITYIVLNLQGHVFRGEDLVENTDPAIFNYLKEIYSI